MRPDDITGTATRGASEDQESSERSATEDSGKDRGLSAVIDPEAPASFPPSRKTAAETSDLERRVLAHERILQSLIAHTTEYDPRIFDRLTESFSERVKMARREQDYTDTEDYAEEFVRAIVRLGDQLPLPEGRDTAATALNATGSPRREAIDTAADTLLRADVRVRERSGVWEVTVNGRFHGDYVREEHAVDAAAVAARLLAGAADKRTRVSRGSW